MSGACYMGTYFKKVKCCFCGDAFVGGFPQNKSTIKLKEQEEKARCGGFRNGRLVCLKEIELNNFSQTGFVEQSGANGG